MSELVNKPSARFEVWYLKNLHPCYPPYVDGETIIPTYQDLLEHYSKVREMEPYYVYPKINGYLEEIFHIMNVIWTEEDRRMLIRSVGLEHTSMSVGDLVRDRETGKWYKCMPFGFREFKMGLEESQYVEEDK